MDFAVLLHLVAAGVGVALVPHLAVAGLPEGVRLVRTRAPLRRSISTAVRSASVAEPGLRRLTGLLQDTARARTGAALDQQAADPLEPVSTGRSAPPVNPARTIDSAAGTGARPGL